jgi:hypothetical protein
VGGVEKTHPADAGQAIYTRGFLAVYDALEGSAQIARVYVGDEPILGPVGRM